MRWSFYFFSVVIPKACQVLKWKFFSVSVINFLDAVQVNIKLYSFLINRETQIRNMNIPS